jgi:hypothetical protein
MPKIIAVMSLFAGVMLAILFLSGMTLPKTHIASLDLDANKAAAPAILQVASASVTSTITATLTATVSPTLTGSVTPTLTLTPGFTPTATLTFQSTGLVPSGTLTVEGTLLPEIQPQGTLTPTATLIPFPTVSMVFPTQLPSATEIIGEGAGNQGIGTGGRILLVVGVLLFWGALIGWYWLIRHRLSV